MTRALALSAAACLVLAGCVKDTPKPGQEGEEGDPVAPEEVLDPGTPLDSIPTEVPVLMAAPQLGPLITPEPADYDPWAAALALVVGSTAITVSDLAYGTENPSWTDNPGLTAYNLASGEKLWHANYTDDLGLDPTLAPTLMQTDVVSDEAGTLVAMVSYQECPIPEVDPEAVVDGEEEDFPMAECDEEEPMEVVLASLSLEDGKVLSTTHTQGLFPTLVVARESVVVYSNEGDKMTAVPVDKLDAEPIWEVDTFEADPDAVIGNAVFTSEGWKDVATGNPAPFELNLDDFDGVSILGADAVVATAGEGRDHQVAMFNPANGEAAWEIKVSPRGDDSEGAEGDTAPAEGAEGDIEIAEGDEDDIEIVDDYADSMDDYTESIWATDAAIIIGLDADESSRSVAFDRKTGDVLWTSETMSAVAAGGGWVLLECDPATAGCDEASWAVHNALTGAIVLEYRGGPDAFATGLFAGDLLYLSIGGKALAFDLTSSPKADEPLWSLDLIGADSAFNSDFGPLIALNDTTAQMQAVAPK